MSGRSATDAAGPKRGYAKRSAAYRIGSWRRWRQKGRILWRTVTSVTSNNYMAISITVNASAGIQAQTSYCDIERYIQPVFTLNPNLTVDANNNIVL